MSFQNDSNGMLRNRIRFLEEQCQSLRLSMKYQRYRLLETDDKAIDLLLRLVPSKIRSVEKIRSLASSKRSWKHVFWRHPFKIGLWMTVKRLQHGEKT